MNNYRTVLEVVLKMQSGSAMENCIVQFEQGFESGRFASDNWYIELE